MSAHRRCSIILASIALVVMALSTSARADSTGARSGSDVTSPALALVHGRATLSSHRAAPGATITMYAWPSDADLQALHPGDRFTIPAVAEAIASTDGSYTLAVSQDQLNAAPAVQGGATDVNVDIITTLGNAYDEQATTIHLVRTKAGTASVAAIDSPGPGINDESTVETSETQTTSANSSKWNPVLIGDPTVLDDKAKVAEAPLILYFDYTYDPRWVRVGQLYSLATSGHVGRWYYQNGASSSLGVGISAHGGYGNYHQGGTASASSTLTIGYPQLRADYSRYY